MPTFQIRPASKKARKARIAYSGPAGSGKTRGALETATYIAAQEGCKVVLCDTEAGSGDDYADLYVYDVLTLDPPYSPQRYTEALHFCEQAGSGVIIIDSITHEWAGPGGCLEMVDKMPGHNKWTKWAPVTVAHDAFVHAILTSPAHVICTIRERAKHEQVEDAAGHKSIVKLGMQPIQREGMDYEFQVVVKVDWAHVGHIDKTRCDALDGQNFLKPGAEFAAIYYRWLTEGVPDREGAVKATKMRWTSVAHARRLIGEPKGGLPASTADAAKLIAALGDLYQELDTVDFDDIRELAERGIQAIEKYEPPKAAATIEATTQKAA